MDVLHRIYDFLAGVGPVMGILWIGLGAFTIGMLVLMYTRWGLSRPIEKCMGLSVLGHILLVGYATTLSLFPTIELPSLSEFHISMEEGEGPDAMSRDGSPSKIEEKPWEILPEAALAALKPVAPDRPSTDSEPLESQVLAELKSLPEPASLSKRELTKVSEQPVLRSPDEPLLPDALTQPVSEPIDVPPSLMASNVSLPRIESSPLPDPIESLEKLPELSRASDRTTGTTNGTTTGETIPEMYKLRFQPDHSEVAERHGGSTETERAVQSALRWLAANQDPSGSWKAGEHGAGREEFVQGRNRLNAGSQADSGVSGLALLAFLASGHTHQDGPYRDQVRRGLEYLLRIQGRDGNLGGKAATYEFMYCHAMATCALSEAYGMTRDARLRGPVERAIGYTVAAQDRSGGGWRYRPGEAGDTSQLGWQVMALKSAELAGIPMPESTRNGIMRYLQSVSSGKFGGLASYRPGEQISPTMSAEAMVCWQFLGIAREHPACNETGDFLLTELPGQGIRANDYYWYYGTLAMYQLQGDYWRQWNAALQKTLLARQIKEGPLAGAWDTDTVWGCYGGRIYTTAIATLSLEVYYRFLPLYAEGPIATVPHSNLSR